jgi:hypothetical protein
MLDVEEMKSNTFYRSEFFGKDWYKTDITTYYGLGWNGATALWHSDPKDESETQVDSPESNWYYMEKNPFDASNPWAEINPGNTPFWTSDGYRRSTHSWTWVGTALAARLMNATGYWNHNAFFDYVDMWMTLNESSYKQALTDLGNANCGANCNWTTTYWQQDVPGSPFTENMYFTYRNYTSPPQAQCVINKAYWKI